MKKTNKTIVKALTSIKLVLFIFLSGATLPAISSDEEEGGIGGTGFKTSNDRLLRPEIPGHEVRPERIDIPERPQRVESASGVGDLTVPEQDVPEMRQ